MRMCAWAQMCSSVSTDVVSQAGFLETHNGVQQRCRTGLEDQRFRGELSEPGKWLASQISGAECCHFERQG